MGLMDMLKTSDPMAKFYAAAEKSNVPQGGITGKLFSSMFPHGLGNLAFGREPEPMPPLETPEGTALMADLASNMMVPGTFIGPKGLARLFGDDAAKGMLATAESKLAQGVPKEAVFQELGVFKGPEGKWRYEIDDSGAAALRDPNLLAKHQSRGEAFVLDEMKDTFGHKELYDAYPSFKYYEAQHDLFPSGSRGSMSGERITLSDSALQHGAGEAKSTLLHEMQHAVQDSEDFARGGSPAMFERGPMFSQKARDLVDDLGKYLTGEYGRLPQDVLSYTKYGDPAEVEKIVRGYGFDTIEDASNFIWAEDAKRTPFGQYQRLAGEAEARAVQDRMNMSMDERRALFPEYAGRNDLIVRGNSGGGLMAAIGDDWMPKAERIKKLRGFVFDSQNSKSPDRVSIRNWNDTIAKLEREVLEMGGEVSPKLVGYEWRNMDGEVHSKWEDGVVAKKVSDWDRKEKSGRSNRDIVHVYWIRGKDGTAKPFGKQSAMKELVESGAAVDERHAEFLLKRMKEQGM